MKYLRLTTFMWVIALSPELTADNNISFARDLIPVFRTHCAICHMSEESPGGIKLYPGAAYSSIVNTPSQNSSLLRIKPGDPEASYFLHKLEGTHLDAGGAGVQMPFGQPPLPDNVLKMIRQWITEGAVDN
jgi:hypothetical protein